ncbi:type II toxin-antitoxin system VapC family toxin [Hoeflea olei]|uniref:type II toxin-antitoxin system VapC family toxin n=1 Tax=Hoeflea olei TaxID=1480615 RepID=UPI001111EB6F|nr:type II toxin-antitoxin system VapC family toxin [Hoeflea olei]
MSFVVDASVVFAWQFPDEDTTYLEIARRRQVALATLDKAINRAARELGIVRIEKRVS